MNTGRFIVRSVLSNNTGNLYDVLRAKDGSTAYFTTKNAARAEAARLNGHAVPSTTYWAESEFGEGGYDELMFRSLPRGEDR
jgi:hypothetical protein